MSEIVFDRQKIIDAVQYLQDVCHGAAVASGWWTDTKTGESLKVDAPHLAPKYFVSNKLCLTHSELSEAMEGDRKNLMDDKLPQYRMLDVESGDAIIRLMDLAGGVNLRLAEAFADKLIYNNTRPDHKLENRLKEGGKTY